MKISLLRTNKEAVDTNPPPPMDCAITAVYDRHVDTVYRVCFSIMGNTQDAEDAVQSVFVKLMEHGKSFTGTEHEKAWLIAIARNHCRDLHRKWWKRKVVHADSQFIELAGAVPARSSEGALDETLRKLPGAYRLVLYLYYYEGYKVAEIAAMLKLNPNTVKTQLRNARKRLKLEIGDDIRE